VLVNRDLIHRWLSAIVHSPVPRRPLLIATALTAAAAVAAGAGATTGQTTPPGKSRIGTLAAAEAAAAPGADRGTAAPAPDGGPGAAAGGSAGKNDRDAKIAAAREKASRAKAAREKVVRDKTSHARADGAGGRSAPARGRPIPAERDLMPAGIPGGQSAFTPSAEQVRNAERIARTGERMGMPPRAQVIAVATALQESKLENLGHLGARNDHDSLGLFQQRPSTGWGTPEQLTDPDYAAEQFYRALQRVPDYAGQPLSRAAQTVQVSAFPDAYAQWEKMAADLVLAEHGEGPYAGIADGK
jgi:hypothetical protein